ncbi:MAG TPA: DUF302 domain-containing protein [Sedimenticola sp.]|nr:DUF302 domain-containing protein [Sedimenticola sp.]
MKKPAAAASWIGVALLFLISTPLWGGDLLMVRSQLPFPQAQPRLEEEIVALGYTLSQARRVDIDLVGVGFTSGTYRAISYGDPEEIKMLSRRYPELTPFLPLQIVIFAERNESLLVALSPLYLKAFFPQPDLAGIFMRWNRDLQQIMENVRDAPPE